MNKTPQKSDASDEASIMNAGSQGPVAVVGVGYVGIQLAILFSKACQVIAYDINENRIKTLRKNLEANTELKPTNKAAISFTHSISDITNATAFLVCVPTPTIGETPDLSLLETAVSDVAPYVKKGDVVVISSTVFPGATHDVLVPLLEAGSSLKSGVDFHVGYCPERIVPGDDSHTVEQNIQVISGQNEAALAAVKQLYELVLPGKTYSASSTQVAESCKLLENIQRDVNIALLNEYTEVMSGLGIHVHEVLDACRTKWNFVDFTPGLVSGHCIPVDPYYLIAHAKSKGLKTPLISAARDVNESFVNFIVERVNKKLKQQSFSKQAVTVGVLGLSIKPNVPDTRHSLSIALCKALASEGMTVHTHDPIAESFPEGMTQTAWEDLPPSEVLVLTKNHDDFKHLGLDGLFEKLVPNGIFVDLSGDYFDATYNREDIVVWSL